MTRTTTRNRGSETLAHALSTDRQDSFLRLHRQRAVRFHRRQICDRPRCIAKRRSIRHGGVQWPDSDSSVAFQVGRGAGRWTLLCVVGCRSRSAAAAAAPARGRVRVVRVVV